MDNVTSPALDSLSRVQYAVLDRIAIRFEAALKRGDCPLIEQYLESEPGAAAIRSTLFQELLALELDYGERCGKRPSPTEYETRFPQDRQLVLQMFRQFDSDREAGQPSSEAPHSSQNMLAEDTADATKRDSVAVRTDAPLPKQLGRYEVLRLIADGGFGRVLLAKDLELDRLVAIKISRAGLFVSKTDVDRFLKEARMAARLSHPNIVSIYDVGRSEDLGCYIVMDYIDGGPLDVEETASRLNTAEAVSLVAQIADGVHHAHTKGLVHRDLKPGNVLLDGRGTPFVADFGLAVHESEQYDHEGEISGTPPYMSPEQVCGLSHRLDGRTDIWSLGVLLYELLAGRKPFQGQSRERVFDEILNRDPKPLRQINDRIPVQLERICLKALAKQPAQRYSTALDFANELRASLKVMRDPQAAASPTLPPVSGVAENGGQRHARRWPWLAAGVPLAVVIVCAAVFGYHRLTDPERAGGNMDQEGQVTEGERAQPAGQSPEGWRLTRLPFEASLSGTCTHLVMVDGADLLAAANNEGEVGLYRWSGGQDPMGSFPHASPITALCLSQDGALLGVICSGEEKIYLYSTVNFNVVLTAARPVEPLCLMASPTDPGGLRFVDSAASILFVRDAKTGIVESQIRDIALQGIQFSAKGRQLAMVGFDPDCQEWIVRFHESNRMPLSPSGHLHSFDMGADGTQFAVGGYNPAIGVRLWDGTATIELTSEDAEKLWYHDVALFDHLQLLVAVSRTLASDAESAKTVIRAWKLADSPRLVLNQTLDGEVTRTAFSRERGVVGLAFDNRLLVYQLQKMPAARLPKS